MRGSVWDVIGPNLTLLVISLAAFAAVIYALFLIGSRASVRWQGWLRYGVFLGPALLLLLVGLIYPALRTIWLSFMDKRSENFIGFDNYIWAFTIPEIQIVLRNTVLWVIFVPIVSTLIGLAIAYMTDRMKSAAVVKSLIFMPMAISFVGASVIWGFMYNFEPNEDKVEIGLLNAILRGVGIEPRNFLLEAPGNTFFLIAVLVWIQTGFAMVIISAAMKNVPDEVVEAAMLDGASNWSRFIRVTLPMIRGTVVVVLTTITIGTLKVFDIVRTMTGGNFQTNVIANEMYAQSFRQLNYGQGSTLAVLLFVGVIPIIWYNVRQLRLERTER
ncbi:MAG: sugar ABC transporter permease [Actinomycetota bacterium]|nr:sugar ABC transporter permease [Actinomycetota bacterium]MDA3002878.1 sugar ABC transporter permease [Actinomycetota bacterium]